MRTSKTLGATLVARAFLLVLVASLITLGWPAASSAQIAVVTDPDGVGGFKVEGKGSGLACDPTEVPEPGFLWSFLVGTGGVAGWARRKRKLD